MTYAGRATLAFILGAGLFAGAAWSSLRGTSDVIADEGYGSAPLVSTTAYVSTGLTFTPLPGYWSVMCTASTTAGNLVTTSIAVFYDGVIVPESARTEKGDGGTLSGTSEASLATSTTVAATGAASVDFRWKSSTAGATMNGRHCFLLKVGSLPD